MKADGYQKCLPIDQADALIDLDIPAPAAPSGRDMLVEIHAVSVNPVDTKVRQRDNPGEAPRILGFDGAGVVRAVGPDCTLFRPGDEVFYAGVINRSGTNAELHLVDERIVGRKPRNLTARWCAGADPSGDCWCGRCGVHGDPDGACADGNDRGSHRIARGKRAMVP